MSNLSRLTALLFMLVLGCSFQQVGFSNAIHSVSLSASSITVIAGGSSTLTVTVTSASGSYYLAVENVPSGVTVSFDPKFGTGTFTATAAISVAFGAVPGNYALMITATTRPGSGVTTIESASASFTLTIPPGTTPAPLPPPRQLLPDLAVLSGGSNPSSVRVGDAVVFTALVQNLGNAIVENIVAALSINGERISTTTITLQPGQTTTVQSTPWKATPGSHVAIWVLDPEGTTQEVRKDNNSLTLVFVVLAAGAQPSVQASVRITQIPQTVKAGATVTITWEVTSSMEGGISHTSIYWGTNPGVEGQRFFGWTEFIKDFANLNPPAKTPKTFTASFTAPSIFYDLDAGIVFLRGHAIVDGAQVWTEEMNIRVMGEEPAKAPSGSQAGQDNLLIYVAITIGLLVAMALIFMRRKPAKKKRSK